jgi:hypothetical protein
MIDRRAARWKVEALGPVPAEITAELLAEALQEMTSRPNQSFICSQIEYLLDFTSQTGSCQEKSRHGNPWISHRQLPLPADSRQCPADRRRLPIDRRPKIVMYIDICINMHTRRKVAQPMVRKGEPYAGTEKGR